ncbi:unnamed protein product [Bathycoccus prasinos]
MQANDDNENEDGAVEGLVDLGLANPYQGIATLPRSSYECRAMQLRSLLWALCLLWANSVSMTESGNLELRPWVPGSGFCDQLVSVTNNLCGLLSEISFWEERIETNFEMRLSNLKRVSLLATLVIIVTLLFWKRSTSSSHHPALAELNSYPNSSFSMPTCSLQYFFKPIEPLKRRNDIGFLLEREGFTIGAELGVRTGNFASRTLQSWKSCSKYVLVDAWVPLDNYKDLANKRADVQEKNFVKTLTKLAQYKEIIEVCRNLTTNCATKFKQNTFDYIYIDARHDFKGVLVDLREWWPLLKDGGIFAGHDYVTNNDLRATHAKTGQDWTLNFDGTIDKTGTLVKGAVDLFSQEVGRQVTVTYREQPYNTWLIRK